VEFRVLGPVEAGSVAGPVDLGPPRQRTVLAALAVDAGRPVLLDTVVDRVWGAAPPERARHALYTYVARLRAAFARAGEAVPVVRRSGGYLLAVPPEHVDLFRYRALVADATRPDCPAAQRLAQLREAVGLWRGAPLADLPGEWPARYRDSLVRQHLGTVARWARAEVETGDPAAVIAPLAELTAEHPLVEPLAAALIRALHAAGRDAEALECYTRIRDRLVDELGADPGAELQQAQRDALRGRPAPAVANRPAQLPLDVFGFTGRQDELAQLDAVVDRLGEQPTATVVAAVCGTAGVGKTSLAVHWAHRAAGRFPDGQLHLNLRGFDPAGTATEPADALRYFLDALGVPAAALPADLDARIGLYRSRCAGRRLLVVLDNARDAEQVRPLLPGSPGCMAVVTSRNRLTALVATEGAHPVPLDLPSLEESRHLLARRLGRARVAAEPEAVERIIHRCARLPLAMAVVAARAATRPGYPLEKLADELGDGELGDLAAFAGEDDATDVRAVFSWSYRALTPEAARLFRLLGGQPGPDIGIPAAASLAGQPPERVRALLADLTRLHLVEEAKPGRFASHDLLRAYAADLLSTVDRRAALERLLDHYAISAHGATLLLNAERDLIAVDPPGPGVTPERITDRPAALAWFAAERPALLAAVRLATAEGLPVPAEQLAWALATFLHRQGHRADWIAVAQARLAAAGQLGDPRRLGMAHRGLARAYAIAGRHTDARAHLRQALGVFAGLGDPLEEARTQLNLGWLASMRERHRESLDHAHEALTLFEAAGNRPGQVLAVNGIGWCHTQLGDHRSAVRWCERALALLDGLDDPIAEAAVWDSLGFAHGQLAEYDRAVRCYRRALRLRRNQGDRFYEAETLEHLGDAEHAAGRVEAARRSWAAALAVLTELNHPDRARVREKLDRLSWTPARTAEA
jgi:DNA-binding SARP family transcriptional activator/tetratricopeptide (TPR) repeat protein